MRDARKTADLLSPVARNARMLVSPATAIVPAGTSPRLQAQFLIEISGEIRQAMVELAQRITKTCSVEPSGKSRSRALRPHLEEVARQLTQMEELAHELMLQDVGFHATVPSQGREVLSTP